MKNQSDKNKFLKVMQEHGFSNARMLAYSKSTYLKNNPNDLVLFNANVFTDHGKFWYGDLNLDKDKDALQKVANATGQTIYVLKEYDGRFFKDGDSVSDILEFAKVVIKPKKSLINYLSSIATKIKTKIKSKSKSV
jgi:hypothetical protein